MTTGTVALMACLCQSMNTSLPMANTMTSGLSTTKMTDMPCRRYRIYVRQMCYVCRQEGHYARDCPQTTNRKPTETKVGRMQTFLRSMTPTERAKFREYVLNNKEKLKMKTPMVLLSRETSPHTNQFLSAAPLSRETGPRSS